MNSLSFYFTMILFLYFEDIKSLIVNSISDASSRLNRVEWMKQALDYKQSIADALYPISKDNVGSNTIKSRQHLVKDHPIYNFLHTYYRYSVEHINYFSPGMNIILEDVIREDMSKYISNECIEMKSQNQVMYSSEIFMKSKKNKDAVLKYYKILLETSMREPHFGCFGLHEWAMLYSGRMNNIIDPLPKHQPQLQLRVSQQEIDDIVESGLLTCTHFDAWRFFHPASQTMNHIASLDRSKQAEYEQPGCIHATMDLFKYAYTIYPMISSQLLLQCFMCAVSARIIDMRASPYDVSSFDECKSPIFIESVEGKKEYIQLQEELYLRAVPLRLQLLQVYQNILEG